MEDHPAQAFRRKEKTVRCTWRRALVKEGKADAIVSAGNTGAVMTTARFIMGHAGVGRSCCAGRSIPECQGRRFRAAGCPARNVDSKPEHLFAVWA